MLRDLLVAIVLIQPTVLLAQEPTLPDEALRMSVEQLRTSVGTWAVTTEFLNEDGSVAKAVVGTYEFSWIVPDRVVIGRSEIPELKQSAGILFYINESKRLVEMVSVGADGALWVMTGTLGGEERQSQEFKTASGLTGRLRFTRSNVSADSFESRMDYTEDGGTTWTPGNRQTFHRAKPAGT